MTGQEFDVAIASFGKEHGLNKLIGQLSSWLIACRYREHKRSIIYTSSSGDMVMVNGPPGEEGPTTRIGPDGTKEIPQAEWDPGENDA